jgi:hypothetical protein
MIEIEFIPIGEEVNTGDAILCHFTEPVTGTDRVILIDGGFVNRPGFHAAVLLAASPVDAPIF